MFSFRPVARTVSVGTAFALLGAAACGGAEKTPFYDSPTPLGSASSGALTSTGGNVQNGGGTGGDFATGGATNAGSGGALPTGGASGAATGASAGMSSGGSGTTSGGSPASGGDGNVTAGGEGGSDTGGSVNEGGAVNGQAGAATAPPVDCTPHGALAQPFDGHCYQAQSDVVTWQAAVDACKTLGAHLVTISSDGRDLSQFLAENAFVWELAGQMPNWLGATDGKGPHAQGDGTYYSWITGEPMTFDNWSSGQPNNARSSCQDNVHCSCDQGACYEHCGFQWDTPGKQMDAVPGWNDRVCDHVLNYVCEWDE
jgi:Lectin C-type domain